MAFDLFHFAQPDWLWALLAIPVVVGVSLWARRYAPANRLLEKFADKHLLPHLIKNRPAAAGAWRGGLALWSLAWALGMAAMAGPQWRYTDTQTYKPSNDLVILLDLSRSMNAADIKPSRLARARQEIGDLLDSNKGLTVGLLAYADRPHMVAPLTDDMRTIRNLLPSLDTSLITVDGDRLKPALEMATRMLGAEPGRDKSILVVSDGDFTEQDIAGLAAAAKGAVIDTLGVGEGAPLPDGDGGWVKDAGGKMVIDVLHADRLRALSAATGGIYVESVYDNSDTRALLRAIGGAGGDDKDGNGTVRTWDEGFYLPALVMGCLLLFWSRKGALLPVVVFMAFMATPAHAADIADWFRNSAQRGQMDFDAGHYDQAMQKFDDPYRQGVAAYKAGHYDQAAHLFKAAGAVAQANADATYNLGNADLMQGKPEDAIKDYEAVLKLHPDDEDAKHNLEIAKKMLQQKQQQQEQKKQDQRQDDKQNQQQKSGSQSGNSGQEQQKDPHGPSQQPQPQQQGQEQTSGQPRNGDRPDQTEQQAQGQDQQKQSRQGEQQDKGQPASSPQPLDAQSSAEQQKPQQQNKSAAAQRQIDQNQSAKGELAGDEAADSRNGTPNAKARAVRPHTQRDIDADQWLNHIQSDPGSFLKNQFMIEEQQNGAGPEERE